MKGWAAELIDMVKQILGNQVILAHSVSEPLKISHKNKIDIAYRLIHKGIYKSIKLQIAVISYAVSLWFWLQIQILTCWEQLGTN